MKNKYYVLFLLILIVIPLVQGQRPAPITLYKNDTTSHSGFHKPFDFSVTIVPEFSAQQGGTLNLTGWWYGTNIMDWRNIYIDDLLIDSGGSDHKISNDTTWYYGIKPRKDWKLYVRQQGTTLYGEDALIRVEGEINGNSVTFTGTWKVAQSGEYGDCFYVDSDEVEQYQGTVTDDDYYVHKITGSFTGWREIYDECHYSDPGYWYNSYRTETRTWAGPFAIGANPLVVDFVDAEDISRQVTGAAADGESKVVVRVRGLPDTITNPSQATVLVGMESGQLLNDGWIEDNTYTQTWQAPEDFGGGNPLNGRREIYFSVEVDGKYLEVPQFYLYKPPLLLVHGIWSEADTWSQAIPYFVDDYFGGNEKLCDAQSYPNSKHFSENFPLIGDQVEQLIKNARNCATSDSCQGEDIVVKNVDILAHSMGGVLSNLHANLGKDNIHKLVTFGTPHAGSEFANFGLYFLYHEADPDGRELLLKLMELIAKKSVAEGATEDLQVGSPAITQYAFASLSQIPVFAIQVNNYGQPGKLIDMAYRFLWELDHGLDNQSTYFQDADKPNYDELYTPGKVEAGMFGAPQSSDYIVSTLSQKGGSTSYAMRATEDHVEQTTNMDLLSFALVVLNSGIDVFDRTGFSPPTNYPIPRVNVTDVPDGTILGANPAPLEALSISITSPANGTKFQPGDEVVIQVAYNGTKPLNLIAEGHLYATDDAMPYTFNFRINDSYLGKLEIVAWILEEGTFYHDIIQVMVSTPEVPHEITTLPQGPLFLSTGNEVMLYVQGNFGNISRDITHIANYSSSNSSVANISADGIITAKSPGSTIINISNGISKELQVYVQSTCEEPINNMIIRKSIKFCPGNYFLPYGFEVDMNNVEIDCQGAVLQGNFSTNGVFINNQLGAKIKNCTIRNYLSGILINNSADISVLDSNIFYNDFGVYIYNSDYSKVWSNYIHNNGYHAIFSEYSYDLNVDSNQLYGNGLSNNYGYGVYCRYASNANITNNNIFGHTAPNYAYGIKLLQFPNALIKDNNIFNNKDNAIQIEFSNNAIIRKNTINNNSGGPYISSSNNSLIYNNNLINNTVPGFDNGNNAWDNGILEGGNYWSNYDEISEGCYDTNINGYCDTPYFITPNGTDHYPFTKQDAWIIQKFSLNLNSGWNLISIPLILGNSSVGNVFKLINYTYLFSYDSKWKVPTKINNTLGYWIKVSNNGTLTVEGLDPENPLINLNNGWNLIGHHYLTEKNVADLYINNVVYAYNNSWSSYIPNRTFNSLQTLKPGYGYWVKIK